MGIMKFMASVHSIIYTAFFGFLQPHTGQHHFTSKKKSFINMRRQMTFKHVPFAHSDNEFFTFHIPLTQMGVF